MPLFCLRFHDAGDYRKSSASYGYSIVTFSLHFRNDNPPTPNIVSNHPQLGRARCPHRAAIAIQRIIRWQVIATCNSSTTPESANLQPDAWADESADQPSQTGASNPISQTTPHTNHSSPSNRGQSTSGKGFVKLGTVHLGERVRQTGDSPPRGKGLCVGSATQRPAWAANGLSRQCSAVGEGARRSCLSVVSVAQTALRADAFIPSSCGNPTPQPSASPDAAVPRRTRGIS